MRQRKEVQDVRDYPHWLGVAGSSVAIVWEDDYGLVAFEQYLANVGLSLGRLMPRPVLVLGDLNSKFVVWGFPRTN